MRSGRIGIRLKGEPAPALTDSFAETLAVPCQGLGAAESIVRPGHSPFHLSKPPPRRHAQSIHGLPRGVNNINFPSLYHGSAFVSIMRG